MTHAELRETLETRQVAIYFAIVLMGGVVGALAPGMERLESAINPALAFMLFVTFLQVPLAALGQALRDLRFLGVLLGVNFIIVPMIAAGLLQFLPPDPLVRLGVLIVLLCPCIDYVVTFSHLGRADARLLLAATPALLVLQMAALPLYLNLMLGADAARLVHAEPFLHAFLWLIAIPLALAVACQVWASRSKAGQTVTATLGLLPVPATALVLFIVMAFVVPQFNAALAPSLQALPIYAAFAVFAPIAGWLSARAAKLKPEAARAVAFSAGTRNSLVVLPLAMAVPGASPILPAIIVTQTLVELVFQLVYIRVISRLGSELAPDMRQQNRREPS